MKNILLFLLLIISASAQAMNPPRKRARDERPETIAQMLNRIERDVVEQIDRGSASAKISLKEHLLNARILQQQTLQPEFGFSEDREPRRQRALRLAERITKNAFSSINPGSSYGARKS